MIRAVALLVDRKRAAHQRLGLGVVRLGVEQNSKLAEQPRGRLRDLRCVRHRARPRARAARADRELASSARPRDRRRRPRSPIPALRAKPALGARRSSRGGRNPARGDGRRSPVAPPSSAVTRRNERIGVEAAARFIERHCPAPRRGRRRRGANPEPGRVQGRRAVRAAAGSPARAARPMSPRSWPASRSEPVTRRDRSSRAPVAALAPKLQITSKADAIGRDMRARLLQPEREAAKFTRQRHAQAPRRPCSCCGRHRSGRAGIAWPRSRRAWKLRAFAQRRENSTPAR